MKYLALAASAGRSWPCLRALSSSRDIFAAAGAPVVAVADGELFQVGWNELGGQRAWLRDDRGSEFYYAQHGYDGVVNPYRLLAVWRRLSPGSVRETLWSLGSGKAPPAAAVLLAAEDISTVVGLETEALARVLAPASLLGESPLVLRRVAPSELFG